MTAKKGRAFLIKIGDGEAIEAFTNFAGMTAKSLKINNERIDVTTPDAVAPEGVLWASSLSGAKSVSLSGDGKLVKDASEARLLALAMQDEAEANFEIVIPNAGTFTGAFSISVELSGDGSIDFTMSMESTGPVTFAAEA